VKRGAFCPSNPIAEGKKADRYASPFLSETFMNNSALAEAIATEHGLSKADARTYVDAVFTAIASAAANGNEVSLNGFGKFKVKDSPAREGRNPANGQTIQIAASKKLTFTPAKAVKDQLNG
jgi:DNA-binding protein HU-beta